MHSAPAIPTVADMKSIPAGNVRDVYEKADMVMDVTEFTMAYNLPFNVSHTPGNLDFAKLLELRQKLLDEEYKETNTASAAILSALLQNPNYEPTPEEQAELLDGLVDVVYIAIGTAISFGWDFNEAWRRVHRSNLSKLDASGNPIYADGSDPDVPKGKILKGPNYHKPDLLDLV